jgi:hypothetical protein
MIEIEGKEDAVCEYVRLWTCMDQLERLVVCNAEFSLSLLVLYRFSPSVSFSLSLCFARKSLLCSSGVSILFLSSALASVKEKWERKKDVPSHAREARSVSRDETIVVLHAKLACCLCWCYSLVAMRDVTPRQLCECTHSYMYMYMYSSIADTTQGSETY